jgi:hypothetical protein
MLPNESIRRNHLGTVANYIIYGGNLLRSSFSALYVM